MVHVFQFDKFQNKLMEFHDFITFNAKQSNDKIEVALKDSNERIKDITGLLQQTNERVDALQDSDSEDEDEGEDLVGDDLPNVIHNKSYDVLDEDDDQDEFGNSRSISRHVRTGGNLTDQELNFQTNSNDSKMTKSKGSKSRQKKSKKVANVLLDQ